MKNGLALLLMLLVVISMAGVAVWWVGMPLLNLALLDDRRDQPYLFMELARGGEAELTHARYVQPLAQLVASEGGVVTGEYRLSHLLDGTREDEWFQLSQFHMARAQDVAQVVTSSPYRSFVAGDDSLVRMRLGGYLDKPANWGPVVAVWLTQAHFQPQEDALDELRRLASSSGAQVVWDAPIQVLSTDQPWEHMFVVSFGSEPLAVDWLRSSDVATARRVASAQTRQLSLALYVK